MAVTLNIITTGSRGSAGAATFRRVRGRTIMSQKRGSNSSSIETRAALGLVRTYREALFFIMSAFCDGMQNSINESFKPTKYGSRRNAFFKLNYSAVETALNASPLGLALLDQIMHNVAFTGVTATVGESAVEFMAFNEDGWDALFNAAATAGTNGVFMRSNIGGQVLISFADGWSDGTNPGTGSITAMYVLVNTATDAGQGITRISIEGTNLATPLTYSVRIGAPTATPLAGTWNGFYWVPSGDDATRRWAGTYTVYITDGTSVKFSRDVVFKSNGAGGE